MSRRALVIGFMLFSAFSTALQAQTSLTDEENKLLALALEKNFAGDGYTVVIPDTEVHWLAGDEAGRAKLRKSLAEKPALKNFELDSLFDRFFGRNKSPVRLTLPSIPGNGYVFDYDGKFAAYFADKGGGWGKWRKENPQAHGSTSVSVPVFDPRSGLVLVYIGTQFAPLAGGGYLVVYKLEKDKLVELVRIMLWIS
jgi:hypothetical protein